MSTPMCALENSKMLWPGWERTPQDLIACIKTLMDCCKMINDEHCKHELSHHIVHAYCHEGKLLGKLMAKPFKSPSCKLADIAVNHFTIQHAQEQVSHNTKPVDAICHDGHQVAHTSHNSNGHTPSAPSKDCPNCTQQHPAGRTNCPTQDSHCSKCNKTGHEMGTEMLWWQATSTEECTSTKKCTPTGSQQVKSRCPPRNHNCHPGQGGQTDAIDVSEDHSPQDEIALHHLQPNVTTVATAWATGNKKGAPTHDELFIEATNDGTIRIIHPKEIMVGDIHPHGAMRHTPPYSCLQVPAEKVKPHSMSRSIPELEAMYYPTMFFNGSIKTRSTQLACPLAWIMSAPDSPPITDPIYPYMVHSMAPSLGSHATLVLNPTR